MNFNPSEIPSLASVLDKKLREADIEIVPGKVTDEAGHFFGNFTLPTDEVAKMTADEIFLLYLKPLTDAIGDAIIHYASGYPLCTKARKLPDKGSKVIGFRCFKGVVPVNVYVCRRPGPDRHQFIVDTHVQQVRPGESDA